MVKMLIIFMAIYIFGQGVLCKSTFQIQNALNDQDAENFENYKSFVALQRVINKDERPNDEQTLNMYLQLDDNQKHLLKGLLQRQEDRKCPDDRCGSDDRNVVDDIDDVLGDVKKQIDSDRLNVREIDDSEYGYDNEPSGNVIGIPYPPNHIDNINPGFQDLTRNEYFIKFGVIPHRHSHVLKNRNDNEGRPNHISPEDLLKFYQDTKTKIVNALHHAIRTHSKTLPFTDILSKKQISLLKMLKTKYSYMIVRKHELLPKITDIVFGEHSNSQIVPHNLSSFKIFVPKWFFERLATHKEARTQRSLLPLTNRQRAKLMNKMKYSAVTNLVSRRSFNPGQFGVPFQMDIQGLGQFNP